MRRRASGFGMAMLMGAAGWGGAQGVSGTVASGVVGTGCRVIVPDAMDGAIASPENHTVLYEDADVRVIDVHSRPHTREAVHTHVRPAVMYIDSSGAGTYKTPDGKGDRSHATDPEFKPVARAIKPEGPHWTENTGEVPFHAIRVEMKHPGCGLPGWKAAVPRPDDALNAAPESETLLMENDDVRVLDMHLAAHAKEAYHTHPWQGVVYVVEPAPLRYANKDGTGGEMRGFPVGVKILPVQAEGGAVENMSDAPLHLIRFELKYGMVHPR